MKPLTNMHPVLKTLLFVASAFAAALLIVWFIPWVLPYLTALTVAGILLWALLTR